MRLHVQSFKHSNALAIDNRIMFDLYLIWTATLGPFLLDVSSEQDLALPSLVSDMRQEEISLTEAKNSPHLGLCVMHCGTARFHVSFS